MSGGIPLTYTIAFRIDNANELYACSILEKARNGDIYLVNQIDGPSVIELFECLTGESVDDY